jgi:hypothetical protein
MNKDKPLIHQGTAPPPAKKDYILFPDPEKARPQTTTIMENIVIVSRSKFAIIKKLSVSNLFIYNHQRHFI